MIEKTRYLILGVLIASWSLGILCFKQVGEVPVRDLSPVREGSWKCASQFILLVVAAFFLGHVGFGVAAGAISFLRGVSDGRYLFDLLEILSLQVPADPYFEILVLLGNTPLFIWALSLGGERSLTLLSRLRGKPVLGSSYLKELSLLLSTSFLTAVAWLLIA